MSGRTSGSKRSEANSFVALLGGLDDAHPEATQDQFVGHTCHFVQLASTSPQYGRA
jgi:hypothetical protein